MGKRSEQEQLAIEGAAGDLAGAIAVGLCHRPPDSAVQALARFGKNKQSLTLPKTFTVFQVFSGRGYVTSENLLEVAKLALESLNGFYGVTGIEIEVINKPKPAFLVKKADK